MPRPWGVCQKEGCDLSRATLDNPSADLLPVCAQDQPEPEVLFHGLSFRAWVQIAIIAGLMLWLFHVPSLRRLWLKTNPFTGEANWGHAICVPLIGLYYLYIHRQELLAAPIRPLVPGKPTRRQLVSAIAMIGAGALIHISASFLAPQTQLVNIQSMGVTLGVWGALALLLDWGLGSLLFGILLFGYGIWPGQNDFLKDFGMVVTLFGVVLLLCGWPVMRIAWFPIVFLICAIPWPGLVYSYIAWPLQLLAAKVSVGVLSFTGVTAGGAGTRIFVGGLDGEPPRALNVAEACAGLRSLMTFISVGAAVAFLSSRPLWEKLVITLSAIPIAILCNVTRVAGQGLLDYYWSREWSEGFAHQFAGLVMLVPAFFLILAVGWFLDRLFTEDARDKGDLTAAGAVVTRSASAGADAPGVSAAVAPSPAILPPRPTLPLARKRLPLAPDETPVEAGPISTPAMQTDSDPPGRRRVVPRLPPISNQPRSQPSGGEGA